MKRFICILFPFLFCSCGVSVWESASISFPIRETKIVQVNVFHGKVQNLYGVNVGMINFVVRDTYGAQAGLFNLNSNFAGFQVGLANLNDKTNGIQAGLFNWIRNGGTAIQVGVWNEMSSKPETPYKALAQIGIMNLKGDLQIGGFNDEGHFQIGIINDRGTYFQLGLFNDHSNSTYGIQIGLLNSCGRFVFPIANICIPYKKPEDPILPSQRESPKSK